MRAPRHLPSAAVPIHFGVERPEVWMVFARNVGSYVHAPTVYRTARREGSSISDFIDAVVVSDADSLLAGAISQINATLVANGYPGGWQSSDATLEVIVMGVISQWAADNANVAATVLPAIFRTFGTQLCNIPYENGAYATVQTTWTFTSPAPSGGYVIPAGTAILISGSAFYVQNTVTTATSATNASVYLIASATGTAYNGLGGVDAGAPTVVPNEQIDWVASVVTLGFTSGGADQQTDDDYEDALTNVLQLQAPRPITASDYAGMVLSDLCEEATGIAVGRATSIDGWYPAPRVLSTGGSGSTVLSCNLVSGSPTVQIVTSLTNTVPLIGATVTGTGVLSSTTVAATPAPSLTSFTLSNNASNNETPTNVTVGGMAGFGPLSLTGTATLTSGSPTVTLVTPPYLGSIPAAGATITGTAIPANTTILASPAPTTTSFTMSANASGNETAETVTISEWTSVSRDVCTWVADSSGNALSAADMDALQTWLGTYREVGFLPWVMAPSYNTFYATFTVVILPNYDPTATVAACVSAITSTVNPAAWGNPTGVQNGTNGWLNEQQGFATIRYNTIIGLLQSTPGVAYVPDGEAGLAIGFTASPTGIVDLVMAGPAPLPISSSETVLGSVGS
jgi:hypothetical protein